MKRTQNERILAALRKGRTLTMLDIFKLCGSLNGHKRLAEIESAEYARTAKTYANRSVLLFALDRVWVKRNGRKLRAWRLA